MFVISKNQNFSIKAYVGDAKTLLAFNLQKSKIKNLAGFTIEFSPNGVDHYYIYNKLQFKNPEIHAQKKTEPAYSMINAPIQKFRWVHVPGSFHQDNQVIFGKYTYTVTPRYFNEKGILQSLDPALSLSIDVNVAPFEDNKILLGFTRGFVQSQAFVNHFGNTLALHPPGNDLVFDTNKKAGVNSEGNAFTYLDEFLWSGFTACKRIFDILEEVKQDASLSLDVFAYDLNEPDVISHLFEFAKQGRVRVILDNASLHKSSSKGPAPEDLFEAKFKNLALGGAAIKRGKFSRYSHDKVFIVKKGIKALKVLTGSTNLSVTGVYVNSNHILIFNDPDIATLYSNVFNESWNDDLNTKTFQDSQWAGNIFSFPKTGTAILDFTFSPHTAPVAKNFLDKIAKRIAAENSSALFAVMDLGIKNTGPIFPALRDLHKSGGIFSYGISDNPAGIALYKPGAKNGVLVTGKPLKTILPPPFNQEINLGLRHQIHHKFVVCGFNSKKPVVYCGSSNLALLGEQENGDNLIAIRDEDIATTFAIEALCLVDHFHFRNKVQTISKGKPKPKPIYLYTNNNWAVSYFDPKDLHQMDRILFA
jgi:hypothetical protein